MEKYLNELLAQFTSGSKEKVYVSVTPGIGIELIQLENNQVKQYGHKPLEYNEVTREISDYEDFKNQLSALFTEFGINPKCNIVLNMPTVHFGKVDLPLLLNDDSITEAITSEVEQVYVFKHCDPIINWFESYSSNSSDTRTIFYSAIQKTAVQKLTSALAELGTTIVAIKPSILSELKGLYYANLIKTDENTAWNLVTVNSFGYSILSMNGQSIIDYYEEPLPLKTYDISEIYESISSSAQLALMNFPTSYMFIVSETDLVSAEHLAEVLNFEGSVDYLENNSYKRKEIVQASLDVLPTEVLKISLEAIGIPNSYPVDIDFVGANSPDAESITINFQGKDITLTEAILKKVALIFGVILIVPILLLLLLLPHVQKGQQTKLDEINTEISNVESKIRDLKSDSSGNFNVNTEIEKVLKKNRAKLISYSSLGESVPKNLWVTYLKINNDGKTDIKGKSQGVEDIYIFYRNMKNSVLESQLRLHKLGMETNSIDDAISGNMQYEFELTDMTESELAPAQEENGDGTDDKDIKKDSNKDSDKNTNKNSNSNKKSAKPVNNLEPIDIGS